MTITTASQPSWFARLALAAIRWYQRRISAYTPPSCRFRPTCSEYMVQAILLHGAARGIWLGVKRLCRCAPWHPGGYDPVPGTDTSSPAAQTDAVVAETDDHRIHK